MCQYLEINVSMDRNNFFRWSKAQKLSFVVWKYFLEETPLVRADTKYFCYTFISLNINVCLDLIAEQY